MLITVSQDAHCWGVECETTNRQDRCVPRSQEEMETGGKLGFLVPPQPGSITKVKIIGHIEPNQHHSSSPAQQISRETQLPAGLSGGQPGWRRRKVRKYACKNTRLCNDAIRLALNIFDNQSRYRGLPQTCRKPVEGFHQTILSCVCAFLVFQTFKLPTLQMYILTNEITVNVHSGSMLSLEYNHMRILLSLKAQLILTTPSQSSVG